MMYLRLATVLLSALPAFAAVTIPTAAGQGHDTEQLPQGGRLDNKGRLNFGVGPGPGNRCPCGPGREQVEQTRLNTLLADLVEAVRSFADLPTRLEHSFWRGGFMAGCLTVLAIEGGLAFLIVIFRSRS